MKPLKRTSKYFVDKHPAPDGDYRVKYCTGVITQIKKEFRTEAAAQDYAARLNKKDEVKRK